MGSGGRVSGSCALVAALLLSPAPAAVRAQAGSRLQTQRREGAGRAIARCVLLTLALAVLSSWLPAAAHAQPFVPVMGAPRNDPGSIFQTRLDGLSAGCAGPRSTDAWSYDPEFGVPPTLRGEASPPGAALRPPNACDSEEVAVANEIDTAIAASMAGYNPRILNQVLADDDARVAAQMKDFVPRPSVDRVDFRLLGSMRRAVTDTPDISLRMRYIIPSDGQSLLNLIERPRVAPGPAGPYPASLDVGFYLRLFAQPPAPPIGENSAVPVARLEPAPAGAPSALESGIVTELNLARADPPAYAPKLFGKYTPAQTMDAVNFMQHQHPDPPLVWDDRLAAAARVQVADQKNADPPGHIGADGSNPMVRIRKAGIFASVTAEEISVGETTPAGAIRQLTVDIPGPDHPHQTDIYKDPTLKFIGVACGPNGKYYVICVIDMSSTPINGAEGQ